MEKNVLRYHHPYSGEKHTITIHYIYVLYIPEASVERVRVIRAR